MWLFSLDDLKEHFEDGIFLCEFLARFYKVLEGVRFSSMGCYILLLKDRDTEHEHPSESLNFVVFVRFLDGSVSCKKLILKLNKELVLMFLILRLSHKFFNKFRQF